MKSIWILERKGASKMRTRRAAHIGTPIVMSGTAMAARRVMPSGAPMRMPSCQNNFFLRLQGRLPQKVQPDGLRGNKQSRGERIQVQLLLCSSAASAQVTRQLRDANADGEPRRLRSKRAKLQTISYPYSVCISSTFLPEKMPVVDLLEAKPAELGSCAQRHKRKRIELS